MDLENKQIAESIRNGTYFESSRAWFATIYIGPVSERTFFLIVAILSGFIGLCSIFSLFSLMPLTEKRPIFLYANERFDDTVTRLVEIRNSGDRIDESLMNFFVSQYLNARESYVASMTAAHSKFVRAQSDDATFAAYSAATNPSNPTNLAAGLGAAGMRSIALRSIRYSNAEGGTLATVDFIAETAGVEHPEKTRWTAKIKFRYTGIGFEEVLNEETGLKETRATDPQFQVTSYELEQKK